ncbi:uncharacterized protein TNCV_1302411 [Trichonephila clavipes]|nr:uncharacterized protein TNCV_1302411 [Trichonephila clavipes]
MCKADGWRGMRDELTVRLTLSKPKEIYKDSLEMYNRSSISSEFNFEMYRRMPELANLVMENSSEGIVKDSEILYSILRWLEQMDVQRMVDIDILMQISKNRVKQIDFVLKWLNRVGSEVGLTKGKLEPWESLFRVHNVDIANSFHDLMRILSSRPVSRGWDNRNRLCDGQVFPDVGQGIMAPWSRRPGCVFGCYGQIGLEGGEEKFWWPANEKEQGACCGPAPGVSKGFFQDTEEINPALDRENLRGETWLEQTGREPWMERT